MKRIAYLAATAVLMPFAAQAQIAPQASAPQTPPRTGSDLTGSLNGAPVTTQAPPVTTVRPTTGPVVQAPSNSAPRTTVTAAPRAEGAPPPPPVVTPAPTSAAPRTPAATPAPAASVPAAATPDASEAAPAVPASPPAATILNAAAIASLPFSIELPPGFRIETGRPGPDFRIYTVKRGDKSFAMIYAGPSSQFPIYSGEMAEVGGRASIVANQDGIRHAMEHLFQRETAPREIHVWITSVEGADQALAERIAQTVDVR